MSGNINFNGWINDDGSENYKCRAWVNFNGTGTVAIRAAGNVSSITDNGTGNYTVNFTTAMVDANYSAQVCSDAFANNNGFNRFDSTQYLTTSVVVLHFESGGALTDAVMMTAAIFR